MMNDFLPYPAESKGLPEYRAVSSRVLSPEESGGVAAGGVDTLSHAALDSRTDMICRPIRVDGIYRGKRVPLDARSAKFGSSICNLVAGNSLHEYPAAPRPLKFDETGAIAAGAAVTLAVGAVDSHAEVNRPVRVDRVYRM